jgi:hypothetical protein
MSPKATVYDIIEQKGSHGEKEGDRCRYAASDSDSSLCLIIILHYFSANLLFSQSK